MNYGSDALKKAIIPDVLAGKKFIALGEFGSGPSFASAADVRYF